MSGRYQPGELSESTTGLGLYLGVVPDVMWLGVWMPSDEGPPGLDVV